MSDVAPRATDQDVLARADSEFRLLRTEDKDFGDLVFRRSMQVPGIVLLRIDSRQRDLKGARLRAVIERFGSELFGRYTVVEEIRFRSRLLRTSLR